MADEPAYLRMLRKDREARAHKGDGPNRPSGRVERLTVQEQEALKWARQVTGGSELKSVRELSGARYAVLLKLASVTGTATSSLEGLPTREALLARLKRGPGMGEEILGAYEIKGGRPITVAIDGDEVTMTLGEPRPGANPLPPEKMLRKAMADAEKRAKTRGRGGEGAGGGGGRGRGKRD